MLLLDTHALLWFLTLDDNMPKTTLNMIIDSDEVYVSIVSLWEIAIKQSIGKLDFADQAVVVASECEEQNIKILQIQPRHLEAIKQLPHIHNDPFDRLIIAQAMTEGMEIITKDGKIHQYEIGTIW